MRVACVAAFLLLLAASASAGTPAANSMAARATALEGNPGALELQSSFVATRLGWSLRGEALASRARFGPPFGESAVGVALAAPVTRALFAEGFANEHFAPGVAGVQPGLVGVRLITAGARSRMWAGYASPIFVPTASGEGPGIQAGGEVAIGLLSFTGSLARSMTRWRETIPGATLYAADTLVPLVTPAREEMRSGVGNAVRLGSMWSATRWSVETMGGVHWEPALPAERWLRVEGAWWFQPRVALRLGVGRAAADSWQIASARRGATVALEWTGPRWQAQASSENAPRGALLHVVNVTGDLRRIEVTAPGAQRVEVMGDFTMWEAVGLRCASAGRFVFELQMAPGVYRVQVRRDGGTWMNPSNLAGMHDPDLGDAGTLVIE